MDDVRHRGDDAVRDYTSRFDRVDIETACVPIDVSSFQLSFPGSQYYCLFLRILVR